MKTKSKFMAVSALVLITFFSSTHASQAFGGPGGGFGGIHKMLRVIGLTDAQKQATKNTLETDAVLQGYKSDLKAAMPALIAARKQVKLDVLKVLANGTPISKSNVGADQAAVLSAEATVAPIRASIRLRVLTDIQNTLTGPLALSPAQIARLNKLIGLLE